MLASFSLGDPRPSEICKGVFRRVRTEAYRRYIPAVFCLSTVDHLMQELDLDEASCAGRRSSPGMSPRAEWTLG